MAPLVTLSGRKRSGTAGEPAGNESCVATRISEPSFRDWEHPPPDLAQPIALSPNGVEWPLLASATAESRQLQIGNHGGALKLELGAG